MADVKINVKVVSDAAKASVRSLGTETKAAENAFKSLNVSVSNTTSAFKVFAGTFASAALSSAITQITRSVFELGSSSIKVARDIETITTQLQVLTGSAGSANKIVKDLQDFAANTPFQFKDLASATQKLLSFGFSAEEAKTNLTVLGDVAAASGSNIQEISLIFGQVSAAGKLTGERLLQLQERAIPIGPAIAKTMGIAESAVRDAVSAGKVDFATFEKAFKSLNDTGEFAFEGMEKRSKTLDGRISTLRDNFELFQANLASKLTPALKAGAVALTELIQNLQKSSSIQSFLDFFTSSIPSAIRFAADSFIVFNNLIQETRQIINTVRAGFNSFAVAAIDIILALNNAEKAIKSFLNIDTSSIDKQNQTLLLLKESLEEVAIESLAANNSIQRSQAQVNNAIESGANIIVSSYNSEKQAATELANEVDSSSKKIIQAEKEKSNIFQLIREEELADQEEKRQASLFLEQNANNERLQFLAQYLGEVETYRLQAEATRLENEGKHNEALKILSDARIKATQKEVQLKAKLDSDLQKIIDDGRKEEAKRVDEDNKKQLQQRQTFFSTVVALANHENQILASIGKAAALLQIALDTEKAVSSSYAFGATLGGPALGAVFGGIATTAMAARAAAVAGLKFESGGIVPGNSFSGDNVQARVNSGEMILNRQQQTQLFNLANGRAGVSGQIIQSNITVELDGDVVARAVSRRVADGLELGEVV